MPLSGGKNRAKNQKKNIQDGGNDMKGVAEALRGAEDQAYLGDILS